MAAAVRAVGGSRFVKNDNQQAVLLKHRAGEQRAQVVLQPVVGGGELQAIGAVGGAVGTIVGVVLGVGHNVGENRKLVVAQVGGELSERHQILTLYAAVADVTEIRKRIMALEVRILVAASVADRGQAFGVGLPGLAGRDQFPNQVVRVHGAGEGIVSCDQLAGGQHEVVADGGMGVGIVISGQAVLAGQTVEVGHGRGANHGGVAVVFLNQQKYVANLRVGDGQGRGGRFGSVRLRDGGDLHGGVWRNAGGSGIQSGGGDGAGCSAAARRAIYLPGDRGIRGAAYGGGELLGAFDRQVG